jgi:DNA-binding response OmpR family regulator
MRIILACKDPDHADWLAHILGEDGFSVVVLPDVGPNSPELRGAELLIVDGDSAATLGDAGPVKKVLLSARGATIDLKSVQGRFAEIIVVPAPDEEVVARVRHVLGR